MAFGVTKLIEVDFSVVSIFYSLMMFLLVLGFIECLCELFGLLSNYHNRA